MALDGYAQFFWMKNTRVSWLGAESCEEEDWIDGFGGFYLRVYVDYIWCWKVGVVVILNLLAD